jgi:predicted HTH domain antitoxin
MQNMQIQFEVPSYVALDAGLAAEEPSRSVRHMLAMFLYEHGKLSLGKACELGGMTQWEFFDLAQQHHVSLDYGRSALENDLQNLRDLT